MSSRIYTPALFLLLICALSGSVVYTQQERWKLTNVQIVDVERGRILPDYSIEIRGDQITAIGPGRTLRDAGLREVDGGSSFVIPGLYDMHVHLGLSGVIPDSRLTTLIEGGVVAVRDMGFPINALPALANVARTGRGQTVTAPRIWFVGPTLNAPSTTKFPHIIEVDNEATISAIVPRIAAGGGMGVKVHDRLSREAYQQVAAAARAQHLPLVGHIPLAVPIDDAINERQLTIEHLGGLTHPMLMACSRTQGSQQRALQSVVPDDFFRLYRLTMSAQFLNALLDGFDLDRCAALAKRFRQAGTWQVPTLVVWKVNVTGPWRHAANDEATV